MILKHCKLQLWASELRYIQIVTYALGKNLTVLVENNERTLVPQAEFLGTPAEHQEASQQFKGTLKRNNEISLGW